MGMLIEAARGRHVTPARGPCHFDSYFFVGVYRERPWRFFRLDCFVYMMYFYVYLSVSVLVILAAVCEASKIIHVVNSYTICNFSFTHNSAHNSRFIISFVLTML